MIRIHCRPATPRSSYTGREWHRWFAWYPVTTRPVYDDLGGRRYCWKWVWLETVWRRHESWHRFSTVIYSVETPMREPTDW